MNDPFIYAVKYALIRESLDTLMIIANDDEIKTYISTFLSSSKNRETVKVLEDVIMERYPELFHILELCLVFM